MARLFYKYNSVNVTNCAHIAAHKRLVLRRGMIIIEETTERASVPLDEILLKPVRSLRELETSGFESTCSFGISTILHSPVIKESGGSDVRVLD